MSNFFFPSETYPFMLKEKQIGELTIDCDKFGNYQYTLNIFPHIKSNEIPWAFKDMEDEFISQNKDKLLHQRVILNWVEERIFPPDRQDANIILNKLGLTEYDQLQILKYTRGSNRYDNYWIKFNPSDDYAKFFKERWGRF